MIVVTCNDGQKVEIPEKYAPQSSLLKNLLEELKPDQLKKDSMSSKNDAIMDGRDNHVPVKVPLTSTVMRKILEYMEHDHATLPKDCISKETINRYGLKDDQGRLDEWEQQYCKMDQLTLFETIKGANYMGAMRCLDTLCKGVASLISGKNSAQIRATFGIDNDWTPEEEEKVRQEIKWILN